MPTIRELRHGYIQIDKVDAYVTIGEDELVVTGSVVLNVVSECHDVWIDIIRHDTADGPVWPMHQLTRDDEDRIHDALAEAARDACREHYA